MVGDLGLESHSTPFCKIAYSVLLQKRRERDRPRTIFNIIMCALMELNHAPLLYQRSVLPMN